MTSPEYRMTSDHSVTVRGNTWYDHAAGQGGGPVSFVQNFCHLSYPEAMRLLLDGSSAACSSAPKQQAPPKRPFALPPANKDMRRLYAYLLKRRFLDREVVSCFVHAGLLYESCEPSKDGLQEYHNAVFVGNDEHGVARHAHKRSIHDLGRPFRSNVEGSDPKCSFHYVGTGEQLYVFEAPIDLLSFLALYRKDWRSSSYVALCGTGEHALLWMLEQYPPLRSVRFCLDHDPAGIEATLRLWDVLCEHGYDNIGVLQPACKDWNEDLKSFHGVPAQEAEEHPQLIVAPEVCERVVRRMDTRRLDYWEKDLPALLYGFQNNLRWGRTDRAMDCVEQASALALALYGRELRRLGEPQSPELLYRDLRRRVLPHRNRSDLRNRPAELTAQLQTLSEKITVPGIRSEADKRALAEGWLDLAASFAKVPVKFEADEQEQKHALRQEMG